VAERAVLIPTAEEDPLVRLPILGPFFALPRGYIFLTPEEAELIARRSDGPRAPFCIVGSGLDPVVPRNDSGPGPAEPFLLYLGRVDPNKGCGTLLRYFLRHRERGGPLVHRDGRPREHEIPAIP
jgi:hypothetical protein